MRPNESVSADQARRSEISTTDAVLRIRDLVVHFGDRTRPAVAVDSLSLDLNKGETLCVVGESGCGKSVTALSVMRLLRAPGRIAAGEILFGATDLLQLSEREMRSLRGDRIAMIFQEPMTSLNPVMSIGRQMTEAIALHQGLSRARSRARAAEMLRLVKISDPERRLDAYPHQFSGGMRQRVMIAMALACNPEILIADEPTTALDVTIQAQILELLDELKTALGTSVLLITHNLGVVAEAGQRVVVMYAGRKVEEASVTDLFARPTHPYTIGLLRSIPNLAPQRTTSAGRERLHEIAGVVPSPSNRPSGCMFAPRCALAASRCLQEAPPLEKVGSGHHVACWESDRSGELLGGGARGRSIGGLYADAVGGPRTERGGVNQALPFAASKLPGPRGEGPCP